MRKGKAGNDVGLLDKRPNGRAEEDGARNMPRQITGSTERSVTGSGAKATGHSSDRLNAPAVRGVHDQRIDGL